jgi:hypothetical protein
MPIREEITKATEEATPMKTPRNTNINRINFDSPRQTMTIVVERTTPKIFGRIFIRMKNMTATQW